MGGLGNIRATYNKTADYGAFKQMVEGSGVQDGDLRLNDNQQCIEKVNFGGKFRRFVSIKSNLCNTTTNAAENKSVKEAFLRAVIAHLNEKQVVGAERDSLLRHIEILVNKDAGDVPLARRTVSWVVQMVDDKVDALEKKGAGGPGGKAAVDRESKTYNGVVWELVGGEKGMRLSKTQFDAMFKGAIEEAKSLDKSLALGLDKMLKYYTGLYETKKNAADLEQFFFGSLDTSSIAKRIIDHLKKGVVPEHPDKDVEHFKGAGFLLSKEEAEQFRKYEIDEKIYGSQELSEKIRFDAEFEPVGKVQDADVPPPDENAVRRKNARLFAADLILNADLRELAFSGLDKDKGERVGRLLMSRPEMMADILKSVADQMNWDEAEGKLKKQNKQPETPRPSDCDVVKALNEISTDLGETFSEMAKSIVLKLGLKPVSGATPGGLVQLAIEKSADVFAAAKVFDGKIQDALSARMEDFAEITADAIKDCLSEDDDLPPDVKCRPEMLKILLSNMDPAAQRRVFSAVLRGRGEVAFDASEKGTCNLKGSVPEMILNMGPLATKVMQGLRLDNAAYFQSAEEQGYDAEKKAVFEALKSVCNQCRPVDKSFVRASIYNILKDQNVQFDTVEIANTLGIGSVAQTMRCRITKGNSQAKNVVIKVFRPSVMEEFQNEVRALRAAVTGDGYSDDAMLLLLGTIEDKIREETDPLIEARNALKGLKVYGQPKTDENLGKEDSHIGSERLVIGSDFNPKNDDDKKAILNEISALKTDAEIDDYIREKILTNNHCMIMEEVKGEDLEAVVSGFQKTINEDLKVPADNVDVEVSKQYITKVKQQRSRLINLSKAVTELYEKFFAGIISNEMHFFHGDLQGGNVKYLEKNGSLTLIDYGKCYSLSEKEGIALANLLQIDLAKGTVDDPEYMLDACLRLIEAQRDREVKDSPGWKKWNGIVLKLEGAEDRVKLLRSIETKCQSIDKPKSTWAFEMLISALQDEGITVPPLLAAFQTSYSLLNTQVATLKDLIAECDNRIKKAVQAPFVQFVGAEGSRGKVVGKLDGLLNLDSRGRLYSKVTTVTKNDTSDPDNDVSYVTITLTDDPNAEGAKAKPVESSWEWSGVFEGLVTKLQQNTDGYGALVSTAENVIKMLQDEKKRLQAFQEEHGPGKLDEKIKAIEAEIRKCLPDVDAGYVGIGDGRSAKQGFHITGLEVDKNTFGGTTASALNDVDEVIGKLQTMIEMYKDASDEDVIGVNGEADDLEVSLTDPNPSAPVLDEVDEILHDVIPEVFKDGADYPKWEFLPSLNNPENPGDLSSEILNYKKLGNGWESLDQRSEELILKTDRPWLEKAKALFFGQSEEVISKQKGSRGNSISKYKSWIGMRQRYGIQDQDKISFPEKDRQGDSYRISGGDAETLDNLYATLSKDGATPFADLDKKFGDYSKGWGSLERVVDDLLFLQVPVQIEGEGGRLSHPSTTFRDTSKPGVPVFKFTKVNEKYSNGPFSKISCELKDRISEKLFVRSLNWSPNRDIKDGAIKKLESFTVDQAAWFLYLHENDLPVNFAKALSDTDPAKFEVVGSGQEFDKFVKFRDDLLFVQVEDKEGDAFSTGLKEVQARDVDGKLPSERYDELLKEVLKSRPEGLEQVNVAASAETATWRDYRTLQAYNTDLSRDDRALFYRKLELAANDSAADFGRLRDLWKNSDKVPTRMDMINLDRDLARFYTAESPLSESQRQRYGQVYAVLQKLSLGKVESPSASGVLTQLDFVRLNLELKNCLRQRWCTSLVGQKGQKDDMQSYFKNEYGYGSTKLTVGDLKTKFEAYCAEKHPGIQLNPDGSYKRQAVRRPKAEANPPEKKPAVRRPNDIDAAIWKCFDENPKWDLSRQAEDYKRDRPRLDFETISFDFRKFSPDQADGDKMVKIDKGDREAFAKSYTAIKFGLTEGDSEREDVARECERLARRHYVRAKRQLRDILIDEAKKNKVSVSYEDLGKQVETALLDRINKTLGKIVKNERGDLNGKVFQLIKNQLPTNLNGLKFEKIDLKDSLQVMLIEAWECY